jgi:ZIP family zinc transporter
VIYLEYILKVTLIGLVSGIMGTSIGGLSAFFIKRISSRLLSFILEFSAGLMMSVVCFELIPEAFELGGIKYAFIGIFAGIVAIIIIENFLMTKDFTAKTKSSTNLLKTGINCKKNGNAF